MIAFDENALICDLAETYQVFDYRSLPARLVATLSSGLRESSRIKTRMRGEKVSYVESLLALIYDALNSAFWSGDGETPKSMYDRLNGFEPIEPPKPCKGYDTVEEYERERERLLNQGNI